MEFRVLGQLEIVEGERTVVVGSHKQRSLLALLLINRDSVLSTDRILDELWGDEAADRQSALWVHVSNLRSALEPDRPPRSEGSVLLTRPPGYVLRVDDDRIDAVRFERMVGRGIALAEGDPERGSEILREALAMWRGRAYEEFTYESFAQDEIARLDEMRLAAVEARIDADLARGLSKGLVSELQTLIRQHPLRERFTAQAMLALYRAGRHADALRAFRDLRSRLATELGVEPSPEVIALEGRMIEEDPSLWIGGRPAKDEPGLAIRGYEIREMLGQGPVGSVHRAYQPEVGREVAITTVPARLADDPSFVRRFEGDARLVAALEHPHIVPLYDFWREPGAAFLVNRLMRGGTLGDVIDRTALSEEDAARIVDQVGDALSAAHRSGVVHGALRPTSVLLDDRGDAYVTNFGLGLGVAASEEPNAVVPPEVAEGDRPQPASDVYSLAVVVAQALTGLHGGVRQIAGALSTDVAAVLTEATDPDPTRRPDMETFSTSFVAAVRETENVSDGLGRAIENPYLGLSAFGPADADVFFGRQRLVDRLVARLAEPGRAGRMVAVVGPSGSGKSSVVNAGLVPALSHDALPGSSAWFVTTMMPGAHPFEALEDALLRIAVDPPPNLYELLVSGESGLRRTARRVLPDDGSRLLIVIDQFEELFTLADPDRADAFLDAIAGAVGDPHSRIGVVATIRADFYDRPLRHREFGELLRDGTEVVTPMTAEELERAITGPVEGSGVSFSPSLVAEIVREVEGRPGTLPLLQHALTEVFAQRSGPTITTETYARVGGVVGALAQRAETLYDECDPVERDVVRQVLLRLITLGEGASDTRRRVLVSELQDLQLHRGAVRAVLDRFAAHRLLTFDRDPVTRGPTVEISHEALLSGWGRLETWIDGAREDVRNQRRLATLMAEWVASGRSDDHLLSGGRLTRLAAWAEATDLELGTGERSFLEASVAAAERREAEAARRETERVEAERRAQRRLRQVGIAAVLVAVVGALAIVAVFQARAAERSEAELAATLRAQDLAASSTLLLDDDLQLAIRLAIEAAAATGEFDTVTPEAIDSLHWAVQASNLVYPADETTPVAVRPGPGGPTGVFAIPPDELLALARTGIDGAVDDRRCAELVGRTDCPDPFRTLPTGLRLAGGDEAYGVVEPGPRALAGTTIELLSGFGSDDPAFEPELVAFEERTGIEIAHPALGPAGELPRRDRDGAPDPDLVLFPQPGQLSQRADQLIELSSYLDVEMLRRAFGDELVDLGTSGGALYGLPADVDLKGLVFYSPSGFAAAGYQVPESWDELIELSEEMVEGGRTPWCHSFGQDGLGAGWPGTDLLETLVLRAGGLEAYDAWRAHEIPFDAPEVREAGRMMERLIFSPGFTRGGPESISRFNPITEGVRPLLREEPECWMTHQADWLFTLAPVGTTVGVDLDTFPFPRVEPGDPLRVTGGGSFLTAYRDGPEVRAFVRHVATPEWGTEFAAVPSSFISPHAEFDISAYGRDADPETAEVLRAIGSDTRSAIADGVWRFDASDRMPPAIGSVDPDTGERAFFEGMIDFVDGVRDMDEVLEDVEAAWVAYEDG